MLHLKFLVPLGLFFILALVQANEKTYKMCVPEKYYDDCITLLKDPSEAGIHMTCVAGRDRLECLDMMKDRKVDVIASEPEDMYVAYHTKNDEYRVISEIRTEEDKNEDFRYHGVILVKKNSNINSLDELRGAKSCHTGFGRNVGYKIPMTKLKNADILKISMDPEFTSTERELKALSEFFSQSCLVGTYSPHPDIDHMLKKKYANLCALCEKTEQCDYPDKFSGYDGAIRCLDKGKGDVAFTKTHFIKKYFGMKPGTTAEGDPTDFEYLCEDGTRRPLTETACSWAQRPWMGYLANADTVKDSNEMKDLQTNLEKFFENGLHAQNKEAAKHLLINNDAFYFNKPQAVQPKEYLEKAGYKDVIERDGNAIKKIKMCVKTNMEMKKCEDMRMAAFSRDIRPEIECVQEKNCLQTLLEGKADVTTVQAQNYQQFRENKLKPIIYESFGGNNVYVAVVEPQLNKDTLKNTPINYENDNERAHYAANLLNKQRGLNPCTTTSEPQGSIQIVHSSQLTNYKNKQLLCSDLEKKPVTEYRICNMEANLPLAIFTTEKMTPVQQDTIKHLFISLSKLFGKNAKLSDVFNLFGKYTENENNILFNDDAEEFVTELNNKNINEETYKTLKCDSNIV